MIEIAVTALFTVATVVALFVTATSLWRAGIAYREIRHALANCTMQQHVFVKLEDLEPITPRPRLRIVNPPVRTPRQSAPQPCGLRAAA